MFHQINNIVDNPWAGTDRDAHLGSLHGTKGIKVRTKRSC